MSLHNCENCSILARYDNNPKSLIGKFWRWHINFYSGWKDYMNSLDDGQKQVLIQKYQLKKINDYKRYRTKIQNVEPVARLS
jgi:hypothetical protein